MIIRDIEIYFIFLMLLAIRGYETGMQFNPTGGIFQLDFAKNAVNRGGPVICVKCIDGLLIVALRKGMDSKLTLKRTQKIYNIDNHICLIATGLLFDANILVDAAKKISLSYRSIYNEPIRVERLASEIAAINHKQTRSGNSRPFGVGLIIAGIDDDLGAQVYRTDPEGSYDGWNAISIGKGCEQLFEDLEKKLTDKNISIKDSWPIVKNILYNRLGENIIMTTNNNSQEDSLIINKNHSFSYDDGITQNISNTNNDWVVEVCTGTQDNPEIDEMERTGEINVNNNIYFEGIPKRVLWKSYVYNMKTKKT